MIRVSKDPDTVFKAYSMTNRELNYVRTVDTGITGISAYRCGRIVTLIAAISTAISVTSKGWVTIGTLPAELCPVADFRFAAVDNSANSRTELPLEGFIQASGGLIRIYLFANESAKPYFMVTYLTYPY